MSKKKPLVINLFAGPGSGKSTISCEVFAALKWEGLEVELSREFAKDEVWAGNAKSFGNQLYLSGIQSHRQEVLRDEVDIIVTDSPVILGCLYGASPELQKALLAEFDTYTNLNFFLERTKPYNPKGRNQTAEEAIEIDVATRKLLLDNGIPFRTLKGDREAFRHIVFEARCALSFQKREVSQR
ncbi:hypothetical protein SPFL3102_03568 [Sporomusaceae bacterium FL31]|nr:hypothetical protein SPFL3101_00437 [Sporomusaceae bacterium FL31]GCE35717.1 hypothetical protein SPFL3102_03568 [Sporomusaceae bacterium]